jgi:hypothetical protein
MADTLLNTPLVGTSPYRLLKDKSRVFKNIRFSSSRGIILEKLLPARFNLSRDFKEEAKNKGILPWKRFLSKYNSVNDKQAPSSFGISPDNLFVCRYNIERCFKLLKSEGMVPIKKFLDRSRIIKPSR